MGPINIFGVSDPDGDPTNITIVSITTDEPTTYPSGYKGSIHAPDADGIGTDTAILRSERNGLSNGRVYEITFVASDNKGGETEGIVRVFVPHDKRTPHQCDAIDDGQFYDATQIN